MTLIAADVQAMLRQFPGAVEVTQGAATGWGVVDHQTIETEAGALAALRIVTVASSQFPAVVDGDPITVGGKALRVGRHYLQGDGEETVITLERLRP